MNPNLQDAVAIFKELGWDRVTLKNLPELPPCTAEQKKAALAALKSGEWVTWDSNGRVQRYFDEDEGKLALFAVSVGVDARRAANILTRTPNVELITEVIARRGAKYAADFIGFACISRNRWWEHSASLFGNVAVRLVDTLGLDIPQSVEYIKDWSVYASNAMQVPSELLHGEKDPPSLELIQKRFSEHVQVGIALNTPATGPFGAVFPEGVKRGQFSREEAIRLAFSALDASVRPGDRKIWLRVLDELNISDEEICKRAQSLIPLLAMSDIAVIDRLAPVLIANVTEDLVVEVIASALSATTKKSRTKAGFAHNPKCSARIQKPGVRSQNKDEGHAACGPQVASI